MPEASATQSELRLIFECHSPGAGGAYLPALDVDESALPNGHVCNAPPDLPEVGQLDVVRHYTSLADRNFSVDGNFYPLGSCTMKYNPRINEHAAAEPGMTGLHPLQDDDDVQGALRMLYELRTWLAEIAGLDEVCLQPCAGAHGEYTALKVIRAYFKDISPNGGNAPQRYKVLAPDTAHGTNPASCTMCGADVVTVPGKEGLVDLDALRELIDDQTMAMMLTNPNTAGLFDGQIGDIADILHDAGAMLYLDGANMNAIVGVSRPGDFGVDVMHYNTHKTFSTPHGCGGPGAGPIAVRSFLSPYLPVPQVQARGVDAPDAAATYHLDFDRPHTIGRVRSFFGQFGVLLRCWMYIAACGPEGLRGVARTAVLNANYLAAQLCDRYETPYFDAGAGRYCAHEFVTVPKTLLAHGVTLNDIAKRLIDFGFHPPTMHWPVHDCLMIEPTETESLATLDKFVDAMRQIADEIESDPDMVRQAPHRAAVHRLDEVLAARKPMLTWQE
ncbi:MAG: aminomethyl-transferring glycine dehydrogenase subunit GcvPB [Phycisphaeraceae bacterium]|jgi:glycine dehydrogenase subunit 2|nr:aminomethyl-transferring glycine dehydrogenase subunit GcvPB [Phycisphaeraceae bacterium]MDP7346871.1 aminomethyl-transferring glycine dehydrogenase subunit GcvPB [Phycisphaeraceae bacterium]